MSRVETAAELARDVGALISRLGSQQDPEARDALLRRLLAFQRHTVVPYQRFLAGLVPEDSDPLTWPALPSDVFRFARVARHAATEDVRVFRTSGTSSGRRGEHPFPDLKLYDLAARTAAEAALPVTTDARLTPAPLHWVFVAPSPAAAPDSSLSYMLGRFSDWFAPQGSAAWLSGDTVSAEKSTRLGDALRSAVKTCRGPVALVGTSFALLFAIDELSECISLPTGSWLLHTGGLKGRTRAVTLQELEVKLCESFDLTRDQLFREYGMTELSSQCYAEGSRTEGHSGYRAPGWLRATVVDPETLLTVATGAEGILRLDDLANVHSVAAVQTSDRAIALADGSFELLGRAPDAFARGCALATEEQFARAGRV